MSSVFFTNRSICVLLSSVIPLVPVKIAKRLERRSPCRKRSAHRSIWMRALIAAGNVICAFPDVDFSLKRGEAIGGRDALAIGDVHAVYFHKQSSSVSSSWWRGWSCPVSTAWMQTAAATAVPVNTIPAIIISNNISSVVILLLLISSPLSCSPPRRASSHLPCRASSRPA